MKVAFFNPEKSKLVEVDNLPESSVIEASMHLTAAYSSGHHGLPSPIWVAFDLREKIRVFFLEGSPPQGVESLLSGIETAVKEYRRKLKSKRRH